MKLVMTVKIKIRKRISLLIPKGKFICLLWISFTTSEVEIWEMQQFYFWKLGCFVVRTDRNWSFRNNDADTLHSPPHPPPGWVGHDYQTVVDLKWITANLLNHLEHNHFAECDERTAEKKRERSTSAKETLHTTGKRFKWSLIFILRFQILLLCMKDTFLFGNYLLIVWLKVKTVSISWSPWRLLWFSLFIRRIQIFKDDCYKSKQQCRKHGRKWALIFCFKLGFTWFTTEQ